MHCQKTPQRSLCMRMLLNDSSCNSNISTENVVVHSFIGDRRRAWHTTTCGADMMATQATMFVVAMRVRESGSNVFAFGCGVFTPFVSVGRSMCINRNISFTWMPGACVCVCVGTAFHRRKRREKPLFATERINYAFPCSTGTRMWIGHEWRWKKKTGTETGSDRKSTCFLAQNANSAPFNAYDTLCIHNMHRSYANPMDLLLRVS